MANYVQVWNRPLVHVQVLVHGPLTRYANLRVTHAPDMPGTFSPSPTSKETISWWSLHASRHVRHARAVMHVGIANPRCGENVPGIPGACATRNFRYQARGPWNASSESQSFQTLEGDPSFCVMTSLWCALNNIFTIYAKLRFNNIKYACLWTGVCYTSLMRQNFPGKNPYDLQSNFRKKMVKLGCLLMTCI